jgi:peptidoglycan/xylan/chitin deacetylase (PgdA/CDA1 family)
MASSSNPIILIVGRLSGPKNDVILKILREVAPVVAARVPGVRFQVVGGPVAGEHHRLEEEDSHIKFVGHQKHLKPFYQKATVVVGAGRVALEAMSLQKPVVAIGERMYVGPIGLAQLEKAKVTNFGDCSEKESFDWPRMARELIQLLKDPKSRTQVAKVGAGLVRSEYDIDRIYPAMDHLYQKVVLEKNISLVHEIPVLMYHQVLPKAPAFSKFNLHITTEDLEKQLQFLRDRGFETVTFEDLTRRRLPRKPILLTFDDGYENNYRHLLPLLRKYRMKAVVYILGERKAKTNFWDTPIGEAEHPLLKPSQILEMSHSGLVEFGSHSMRHARLTLMKTSEIQKEVAGSKKALEDFLKKPVLSFAYPYGSVNEEIKKMTRDAGYTFGIAVNGGPTRFGDDLFEIRRVHLFPKTSMFEYFKKTSGFYLRYRKLIGRS